MKHHPRTVIITGASSGIGLALAEAYLARGDNVIGNARTAARLQAVAAKLASPERFVPVVGDIADPATAVSLFDRAIAEFGGVDILINNAGIFDSKPFAEYSPATIDAVIDTNLRGFVHASQQAIKHMQPRKAGHIINISASIAEQPLASVPATLPILVKGGINSATKSLAIELAPYNIKVSAVAPGIIDTPLFTRDLHSFLHTLQPLGRMGSTADIVAAVMYLTDSDYSTGVILPVDGGMSAGHW